MIIFTFYEKREAKSELAIPGYTKLIFRKRSGFLFRATVLLS